VVNANAKRARPWIARKGGGGGNEETTKVYASALAQFILHSCMEHITFVSIV
jgi:hypothetical protein